MFEYKGSQFTLDQIEQRAKEKGLTLQEYLSANPEITEVAKEKPIEEVKTTPVVPDAVAGEEIASDTVLPSDPGLSDLVGPSETPKVDTSFIPFESPEAAKTAEQEIEILKKAENDAARATINEYLTLKGIKPGEAGKDEGEFTEISVFEEAQRISKSEKEAREKRKKINKGIASGEIDQTAAESSIASAENFLNQLAGVDDRAKFTFAWLQKEMGLSTESSDKRLAEANAEMDRLNSMAKATIGFTDLPEKKGIEKVTGGLAALFGAVSSFGASMLTSYATFGTGLATDMIGGSIKDYNDQKAETLGISTSELIETGQGETLIPGTIGALGFALEKRGIDGASKAINAMAVGKKKALFTFLNSGRTEGWTEWLQGGLDKLNNLIAKGEKTANIGFKVWDFMTSKEGFEIALQGFFGGGAMSVGGGNVKAALAIRNDGENKNIINKVQQISELEASKFKKNLTPDEIGEINAAQNSLRADLIVGFEKNKKLINVLNQNEINEVNKNFNIIESSESKIQETINSDKYTDETKNIIVKNLRQNIDKANQEIYNIRNTAEKITQSTETIKEKAGEIKGVKVKDFETTKEVEDFVKQQNPDQDTTKASEQQGFIVQNPNTGEQTIVINKEVAKQEKAVNVAAHEFLHAILYKTVKDSPETSVNLGNALLNELNKIDASQIKDSKFKKRMEQYADQSKDVQMEEALTLFSDAIATGDIKFSENVFTKMGDVIRRSLQKLGVNIKFNNGRDVYNFVKDYNASIAKGDLSLAQVKAAARGVEGRLVTPKQQEQEIETIIKESKSDSDAVQTIFEQKGKEGAFEIIEKFKPITNRIVQRRSEAPGFDRQLLTDEIETGKRGILDLISEYKPESGVPLAAYINKFLPARAIEASNRVLDTEFKLDVTEARGVTDTTTEEVTEQVAEKPTKAKESLRKKIKLDKATTQKVIDAVTKTFGTKLPPVDSPQFKKALQKGFRTELKTTIAKDVLGSRAAYETFLRDNFENIYEAIPQEIINKRFRPFAEDTGKREKTKEGKKIFKKKDITKAEFINYFLGRDVGTSTKGTRKDALAEALAEEFAFDATMETIQKPEVIEKREFVDKTQTTEKVSEAIKRPIDLKFSKTASNNQNLNKSLRSLKPEEQTVYRGLLPEFISSIAVDNYNVDAAFQSVFGNFLNKSDGTPSKKREEIISEWKKVRKSIIKNQKDFKTGKPKKININDYLTQAFEEQTETEVVRNILGVTKGGVNFRDDKQIMGYVNFMNELVGSKMQEFKGNDLKIADYVVNILGPTLSAGAKVGGNNFMWELNKETDLLHLVPSTLKRSSSLRTSIFGNQKEMSEVLIKPFLKKPELLTYKGNAPQYNGKPLLKPKVAQKVDTYVTSLNKTGGISKNMLDDSADYAKKNQNAIIDILDFYKGLNKESEITINDLAMFFAASNGDMTALVRAAARVDSFAKSNSKNKKDYRYEHNPPARTILVNMAKYVNGQMTLEELKKGFDNYTVSIIPKQMDDVINERYKDSSPLVGSRYYNSFTFGRFPFSMTVYEKQNNGNYKTKVLGAFAPQAYKEVQAAKAKNINSLPSKIQTKFSKTSSNQNVLNEMQRLDTEAQDARIKFSKSKDLNKDFNDIIEKATGIGTEKRYGQTKARAVGADKGKFNLLGIPPSAQDFVGLTRYFAGKSKQGDKTIAWVKENFLDPFARANIDISNARVALANDFKALKKLLGVSPKDLNKKITGEPYTVGNAVRVYTWVQQGMTIPGLSKADQKILEDYVTADENLVTFANELIAINKDNGYPKPTDGWLAGTITTDLLSGLNTVVRAKYLKQWQNNVDEVFSETNMNKLEAAYGKGYRDALENMLGRMKTGSNRGFKGDTLTGRFIDWINNSVGAIMFFNMRSAVLQTISAVNFVNWSDNNPLKASAAFANQPQYWKDVMKLMNSDYLIERRNGLKINVSEADIAEIAAESKNKAKAFISKILKLGFLPTQIADSFAIASGGATFYRNRYKSLKKEGLSDKEAEAQAFQDFREIAEESQQSSRPDRISQQQAGPMGRIILAFANTPAQYARLMQKAASDLKNRRGDDKTNISKILYYGAIQNVIFNALQQALFAMAFGDEEPDEEKLNKKYTGIANGMADSLLRGVGFHGAAISTLKNVVMKLAEGKEAQDAAIELLDISPPISSKIGKLKSAGRTWDWNKKEIMEKGWSLDNPAYLAAGQVISAATNVPLDRGIRKLQNLKDASDAENEEWMRVANALGWAKWELEWQKDKPKKGKTKSFFKTPKINIPKITLPKF